MEQEQVIQDPGRADYVPKGKKKKYTAKFDKGDGVWLKVATKEAPDLPDIVVYVKQCQYENEQGREGWVYEVQEQDKEGVWCGRARWKREVALKDRA